ncbi:MAG: hypothetical protein OXC18_23375 [Desulfurellaceae bacterium]|nr:hypothetical protein [Desulfurellaceae bacterium]
MASKESLLIGALLYDIGRFEFRKSDQRTHPATYGDFFVTKYLARFRCLAPILEEIRRLLVELDNPLLREADCLAAAGRRVDGRPETLRSLVSVLTSVDISKGEPPEDVYRYVPGPVDFANPFPEQMSVKRVKWPEWKQPPDEHDRAWKQFCAEIEKLPDGDLTG